MKTLWMTHSLLGAFLFFSACGGTPPTPIKTSTKTPNPDLGDTKNTISRDPKQKPAKSFPLPSTAPNQEEGMDLHPPLSPLQTRKLSNDLIVSLSRDKGDPRDRVLVFFPRKRKSIPVGMAGIQELTDRLTQHRLETALEEEFQGKAEAALSVRTYPGGVMFQLAGRRGQLGQAQKILLENLMDPGLDPTALPRYRAMLLQGLERQPRQTLLRAFVSEVLGLGLPFPDTIQHDLPEIQPAALSLFQKLNYRPEGAVVLLQGAGWKADALRDLGNDLLAWKARHRGNKAPNPKIPFFSFAASPQFPKEGQLLLLLPNPALEETGTPLSELCWQLFCMDGLGGRLGQELEARGLGQIQMRLDPLGEVAGTRILSFSRPGKNAKEIIAAVRAAIAALSDSSPERSFFDQAKQRVLLSWDRKMNQASLRAETLARSLAHGQGPNLDQRVLQRLQALRPDDIPEAAEIWLKPAFLLLSSQEQPPQGATMLGKRDLGKSSTSPLGNPKVQKLPGNPEDWEKTKTRVLAKARKALGFTQPLTPKTSKTLRFDIQGKLLASLPFKESWVWDFGKRTASETFEVLNTKIGRRFHAKGAEEILDQRVRKLSDLEAENYLQTGLLNPLVLLDPQNPFIQKIETSGSLKLKEGKDLVLFSFDLVLAGFHTKASLAIDPDTGLPRRLLYEAPTPGGSRVRTIYLLQEYRMEKGLRFPHTLFRFDQGAYRGELSLSPRHP